MSLYESGIAADLYDWCKRSSVAKIKFSGDCVSAATINAASALLEACCAQLEGKTQRQKNPHPTGSLAYAAWVCARLGGWTGYYGKPGPIVMRHGWLEFQARKRGANLLNHNHQAYAHEA